MDKRTHRSTEIFMGRRAKRFPHRGRTWRRHAQRRHRQSLSPRPRRAPENVTTSASASAASGVPQAAPPRNCVIQSSAATCHAKEGCAESRRTRSCPANPRHHRNADRRHMPLAGRRSENARLPFLRTPNVAIVALLRTARRDRLSLAVSSPPSTASAAWETTSSPKSDSISDERHARCPNNQGEFQ